MHGNELRKNGQPAGLDILERAVTIAAPSPGRGAAVALLARAAASADDPLAPLARDVARSLVEAGKPGTKQFGERLGPDRGRAQPSRACPLTVSMIADAVRHMSVHSRKQPDSHGHSGTSSSLKQ